jgi:O-antigen ligase
MLIAAPLILNVVLLCNSRGGFLAAIASALTFLVFAPRAIRKYAIKLLTLGAVAVWLLLGDPAIVTRFWTIFADPEERDAAAASRLEYWKAGFAMIADYPFGEGGDGFHDVHGPRYLAARGHYYDSRSVHNGYINEACDWGIQGLALRLALMGGGLLLLRRVATAAAACGDMFTALTACAMIAGLTAFLSHSLFGDYLDNEWGYWIAACAVGLARVYGLQESREARPGRLPAAVGLGRKPKPATA